MGRLLVIMGPAGSGKTAIANAVATTLNIRMLEADDFHSPANIAHMASGQPLTDAMREPWIKAIERALLQHMGTGDDVVLAYSGLRRAHRARIRACAEHCLFLDLQVSVEQLTRRLAAREAHFMGAAMLCSQLAAMENALPEEPLVPVAADGTLAEVVANTLTAIEENTA